MINCQHSGCGHQSTSHQEHINHDAIHFTASVMGNPEYLAATKDVVQAKDQRMEGLFPDKKPTPKEAA